MTNSVYVQNAQRVTRAIRDSFIRMQLENLPALANEYTLAILELIQAEGHWAIGNDTSISLGEVAEEVLGFRTKDGYSIFDGKNGARLAAAFVEYLPLSVQHARMLFGRSEVPMDKLVNKLIKMNFDYQLSSNASYCALAQDISRKSKVQADRLITDILDGKTRIGQSADLSSVMFLIKTGLSNDKPSAPLLAAIKAQESEILKHIGLGDSGKNIKAINEIVKMPVGVLTNLKIAGCDTLLGKIMNLGSVDYTECSFTGFFNAGGKLPDTFVSAALSSAGHPADLRFAFAEALFNTPENLHAAARFINSDKVNSNAEIWLKSLGDAIVKLRREGVKFERKDVVDLIEPLTAAVENKVILKGAALASGIDGIYLAAVPSLKEFKGEFIHQELGL